MSVRFEAPKQSRVGFVFITKKSLKLSTALFYNSNVESSTKESSLSSNDRVETSQLQPILLQLGLDRTDQFLTVLRFVYNYRSSSN